MDDRVKMKVAATTKAIEWLGKGGATALGQLQVAEAAVDECRRTSGLVKDKGGNLAAQRLSELNAQLGSARLERVPAEAKLQAARDTKIEALHPCLNQLQREADVNRAICETFLTRYNRTIEQQGLATPDARLVSPADQSGATVSPKKLPIPIIGGMGGLAVGVVLLPSREPGPPSPTKMESRREERNSRFWDAAKGVVLETIGTAGLPAEGAPFAFFDSVAPHPCRSPTPRFARLKAGPSSGRSLRFRKVENEVPLSSFSFDRSNGKKLGEPVASMNQTNYLYHSRGMIFVIGLLLVNATEASGNATYTYDLVQTFGAAPHDTLATDRALHAFSVEAQKRTRPPEATYRGYPGYYPDASKDSQIVLTIPAGTFTYSWNKFTKSIRHLKIAGAGSGLHSGPTTILQNINDSRNWRDQVALDGNWDYFTLPASRRINFGYLIHTANAGASQVSLVHSSNSLEFTIGRWVLVMSYSQQWYGYPPNMRYYDYAKVTAINPSTGAITLDTPLRFTHRSDRPYHGTIPVDGAVGPASIVPIDTPERPVEEYVEFDGIHVLGNPNWDCGVDQIGGDVWQLAGIIDGSMDDFWIDYTMGHSQLRNFTISNSRWLDDESDKIINRMTYQNDNVQASGNHAGQLFWRVVGGTLGTTNIAAQNVMIEGGTIINRPGGGLFAGVQLDDANYTNAVVINGVTFVGDGSGNPPISGPQANQIHTPTITVDGTVVTLPDGQATSRLAIRKDLATLFSPSEVVVDNWGDGAAIMKNGAFVPGATVSLISGNANYIYVDVSGTTFSDGDQIYAAKVQSLTVTNSVGQNTGFDWSSYASLLHKENIPTIIWSGNSGN